MTRPLYESSENQKNESEVALAIAKKWAITVQKLKPRYRFDYAFVYGGEITGFLEVKCRTFSSNKHESYMISMEKVLDAITVAKQFRVRTILAVKWTDCIGWIGLDIEKPGWILNIGGRNDRDDPQDIEPVVYIPISQFKTL